ncbi:Aste57867_16368 [Aphanomyces stellatus]|uniref:Aste57867_16368 protein n=1 Tax=Aphanomyces stellatus TaxID=120398 RepID=A0A485L5G6_9STRA|nr:hypothetical protein As57867_016311 [Aphanomyces stellatus]VFT93144.1 Aste57867_16368 [Aphanomyces stellatus]
MPPARDSFYFVSTTPVLQSSRGSTTAGLAGLSQRSLAALRPRQSEFVTKVLQAPSVRQLTGGNDTRGAYGMSLVSTASSMGKVPMLGEGDEDDMTPRADVENPGLAPFDALKLVVHKIADADGAVKKTKFHETFGVDLPDSALETMRCASILLTAAIEMDLEDDEKLRLIFDTMDEAGTGYINRTDVADVLKAKFASVKLQCVGTDCASLADVLFVKAKAAHLKQINYAQFCLVFREYIQDTKTAAADDAAVKAARGTHNPTTGLPRRQAPLPSPALAWYRRNHLQLWWLLVYIGFTLYQGVSKAMSYPVDSAVGWSLRIARGMAQISMSNMCLALLPMCRTLLDILKQHTPLGKVIPFDDLLAFHRVAGAVALLSGLIHTGAHVYNEIVEYLVASPDEIARSFLVAHINPTERGPRGEAILPPFVHMLTTIPILTGVVMLVISLVVLPTALIPSVRQRHFNVFWYSHMLLGVFLVAGCVHGATSWLSKAQSFYWILPPFLVYLAERRVRFLKYVNGSPPVQIASATIYTSTAEDTLALKMVKPPSFRYTPGMYTFINVPAIAAHEWHPFTISSAPCDPFVSLHIRKAGDWTGKLHALMARGAPYPPVYLDGPVGAPTQAYIQYKTIVMVGGGIGVTPFASVLTDVVTEMRSRKAGGRVDPDFKLEKLYFHWTTRQQDSLRWFEETMNAVHALDADGTMVETHQHLTSVKDAPDAMKLFQAMMHKETGTDVVSGLATRQLTHFGRPKWHDIFGQLAQAHAGETIGVFFCGPHVIDAELDRLCREYATTDTRFEYHSEKFA